MRFVDIVYSIPFLFIVLVLATKFSATVLEESLLLGFFSWLVPARLMRGEVLSLRERDFVWAARVMGSSRTRLIYKHLIPNSLSVVIVNVTFLVADSILALAFLGFLGFGLQYPTASWGDRHLRLQRPVVARLSGRRLPGGGRHGLQPRR
jgi:peptide/nickel transport system permease protein